MIETGFAKCETKKVENSDFVQVVYAKTNALSESKEGAYDVVTVDQYRSDV